MIVVPWVDAAKWRQEISLDGLPYVLEVHWNVYAERYVMSLRDRARELLLSGAALVKGQPLLSQVRRDDLPPGELFVIGSGQPTRSNMGVGCQLVYMTEAETDAV